MEPRKLKLVDFSLSGRRILYILFRELIWINCNLFIDIFYFEFQAIFEKKPRPVEKIIN